MERRLEITPLSQWNLFPEGQPLVIAGPCSAESEIQVMETARRIKALGVNVFRAGIWKPRTHPNTFEGVGAPGLKWMQRVKNELGMKVCTEVASERHVFDCLKYGVDMVWLGARTTANPFLVQEIAEALRDVDIPVLVKNPVSPDLDLWIGALERLNQAGIRKIGVIHRGFSTFDKIKYRNSPEFDKESADYHYLMARALEKTGKYREALKSYDRYDDCLGRQLSDIFDSGVGFMEERYNLQQNDRRQDNAITILILWSLIGVLTVLLLFREINRRSVLRKMENYRQKC